MPRDPHRRAARWTLLPLAALIGASLGFLDASHWLVREMTPSLARRVASASLYAAVLSALAATVAAAAVELVVALGRRREWRLAASSSSALRWTAWSFVAVFGLLLLEAERRFSAAPLVERRGVLAACLLTAAVAALLVATILRRVRDERLASVTRGIARPRWWLALSVAALAIGTIRIEASLPSAAESPRRRTPTGPTPPNVVLVVADTLRADALGCYGSRTAVTPTIDSLAERGVLFEHAVAPSSWTLPSVTSILTSEYPHEHGFVDFVDAVRDDLPYLPEVLARRGYRTLASVGNVTMREWRGFDRGFDFYDVYGHLPESRLVAARLVSGALLLSGLGSTAEPGRRPLLWPRAEPPFLGVRWSYYTYDRETNRPLLERLERGLETPFFLYVHYLAPHEPYLRHPMPLFDSMPALEPANLAALGERYDSEVSYLDAALGELLAALAASDQLDGTIVAFTADHGEAFQEHGRWGHGRDLYQEVLAVPLIFAGPGLPRGERRAGRVSLTDIAPTLADLTGLDEPTTFRGRSLFAPPPDPGAALASHPVLAETSSRMLTPRQRFAAAFDGPLKLIRMEDRDGGKITYELYDLERDPHERNGLDPGTAPSELTALVESLGARSPEAGEEQPDNRDLEALRALGYVD